MKPSTTPFWTALEPIQGGPATATLDALGEALAKTAAAIGYRAYSPLDEDQAVKVLAGDTTLLTEPGVARQQSEEE